MTRRRTTRTITFRGGPDDGIVGQHPIGYEEIRANTVFDGAGLPVAWDEYRGPGGAGAAEFHFTRHIGMTGNNPPATVYVAPAGAPLPTLADLNSAASPWSLIGNAAAREPRSHA